MALDALALEAKRRGLDPSSTSALLMRMLGSADPSLTGPVLSEGFAKIADPLARARFGQELETGAFERDLALRGVRGPGADQERALLGLQQTAALAPLTRRPQAVTRGEPIPGTDFPIAQPVDPVIQPGGRGPRTNFLPTPATPFEPAPEPGGLRGIRAGLRASRMRESAQATQESQLRGPPDPTGEALGMAGRAGAGIGLQGAFAYSPDVAAAWAANPGVFDLTTPTFAFAEAEQRALHRGRAERTPVELGRAVLSAWHEGQTLDAKIHALEQAARLGPDQVGFAGQQSEVAALRILRAKVQARYERDARAYGALQYGGTVGGPTPEAYHGRRLAMGARIAQALGLDAKAAALVASQNSDEELEEYVGVLNRGENLAAYARANEGPAVAAPAAAPNDWRSQMFARIDQNIADSSRRAGV